jgi:Domain of unknown function (DUF4159)
MKRLRLAAAITGGVAVAGAVAFAQFGGGGGQFPRGGGGGSLRPAELILPNTPYDGKFTFVRLRYGPPVSYASQRVMWSHDYPIGERNFMRIMNELTYLGPHLEETNILALDDPELFKYPIAYLCEPGYQWTLNDQEASNFRDYLVKGGFLIVDDFRARDWPVFEEQMRRVLPDVRFFDLDAANPTAPGYALFHSFFEIDDPDEYPNFYDPGKPIFRGIFENNDPTKRLMAIINYNTDISEFWEFSGTGLKPIDESNDAYKLGVNYIIYAMTH